MAYKSLSDQSRPAYQPLSGAEGNIRPARPDPTTGVPNANPAFSSLSDRAVASGAGFGPTNPPTGVPVPNLEGKANATSVETGKPVYVPPSSPQKPSLVSAAGDVAKKAATKVYDVASGLLLPGSTTDERHNLHFLWDVAQAVPGATVDVAKNIITHPFRSSEDLIGGLARGIANSTTDMMLNLFVNPKERQAARAEVQATLDKYLTPPDAGKEGALGALAQGGEVGGGSAPYILGGELGGAAAGGVAARAGLGPVASKVASLFGEAGGFVAPGQAGLIKYDEHGNERPATAAERLDQALNDVLALGIFKTANFAASKAKGLINHVVERTPELLDRARKAYDSLPEDAKQNGVIPNPNKLTALSDKTQPTATPSATPEAPQLGPGEQIANIAAHPDTVQLYRGAANPEGVSFTPDRAWALNFKGQGQMLEGKLPADAKVKVLDPAAMQEAMDAGAMDQLAMNKHFFDQGYDAVAGTDAMNSQRVEVIVNPKLLHTFKPEATPAEPAITPEAEAALAAEAGSVGAKKAADEVKAREATKTQEEAPKAKETPVAPEKPATSEETSQTPIQYHGSPEKLGAELKPSEKGTLGEGFYLTQTSERAASFSKQTKTFNGAGKTTSEKAPVNIHSFDTTGLKLKVLGTRDEVPADINAYRESLKAKGYDGIELKQSGETVVFPDSIAKLSRTQEAPAPALPKGQQQFYIYKPADRYGGEVHPGGYRPIPGKLVDLGVEGVPQQFFIHRTVRVQGSEIIPYDTSWTVSEVSTGARISEAATQKEAIAKAAEMIGKAGPEGTLKAVQTRIKENGPAPRARSQKEQVQEVVKEGPKSIKEVADQTGILEPNVRRILGVGAKDGTFERVDKGVYVLKGKDGKETAWIEAGDAQEVVRRMADEGRKFDMVFLDPAYFSRALIGGNRGIKAYDFITPHDFQKVSREVFRLVRNDDTHVYLMLSGARTAQADMLQYANKMTDSGFTVVGEGSYTKLTKDGELITNVRGVPAAPERVILYTKSGTARAGEIPKTLDFRFIRPSIAKSYATEKPRELLKALIEQSTLKGESILDPFAGSGVAGEQALQTGRKPTLIEKKPEVVENIIKPRLEKAAAETKAPEKKVGGGGVEGFNPKDLEDPLRPETTAKLEEITKQSDIVKYLSDKLDVPIRRGKFMQRALGIYKGGKSGEQVVRLKAGGLATTFHEVFHHLNQRFTFADGLKGLDSEREALLAEYHNPPENPARRRSEAFSEFGRFIMTGQEAKALRMAPTFFTRFQAEIAKHPDVKEVLDTAAANYKRWLEQPATARVLSQIAVGKEAKGPLGTRLAATAHDLYTQALDDLHPLSEYSKIAREANPGLKAEADPYILARNLRGWVGRADTFLRVGTFGKKFYKEENGAVVPDFKGKSFEEIVKPFEERGALDDLRTYLVAKRTIELSARDIKTGITARDAEAARAELEQKHPDIADTQRAIVEYQDALLNYAHESGLMDAETLAKMRDLNKDYVPFYRIYEEAQNRGSGFMGGKQLGSNRNPVKRIKGSEREIVDPLESIVKNTYSLINAADRNAVAVAMTRLSKTDYKLGRLVEHVPQKQVATKVSVDEVLRAALGDGYDALSAAHPDMGMLTDRIVNIFKPAFATRQGEISVMDNGTFKVFEVEPDLYRAIQALDKEDVSTVLKLLSYPASWLRAGATLTPDFALRNPIRDQFSAYVYSKGGFLPGIDMARGLFELFNKGDAYTLWKIAGGESSTLVSIDREGLQKNLKEILRSKGETAMHYVKNPVDILREFSNMFEVATRLGEMKRVLAKTGNPTEAAFAAREITLDFNRIGAKTRAANMIIAFWNANVQGLDKMLREMKTNPGKTMTRTLIGITLPSLLLYMANRQDPRWKEIPQWEKDLFWIIMTKDHIIRIPKPFELGVLFGSVPERIAEYIDTHDPEVFNELETAIASGAAPGFIPTGLQPIIENISNYSFFLDRPIVPQGKQGLPAEFQATDYTSEVSKVVGETMGYSPAKIDNLIYGYSGGLGRYATQLIDSLLVNSGTRYKPPPASKTIEDIAGIKAFLVRNPQGSGSESVNRLYNAYESSQAGMTYVKKQLEQGNTAAAQAYAKAHPEVLHAPQLSAVVNVFSALSKAREEIMNSKTLNGDEKKKRLDKIDATMTEIAAKAMQTLTTKPSPTGE